MKVILNRRLPIRLVHLEDPNHNGRFTLRANLYTLESMAPIISVYNDAMIYIWNSTDPFDNMGLRTIGDGVTAEDIKAFFDKEITPKWNKAVEDFIANYGGYVKQARQELGDFFKEEYYPSADELVNQFKLELQWRD